MNVYKSTILIPLSSMKHTHLCVFCSSQSPHCSHSSASVPTFSFLAFSPLANRAKAQTHRPPSIPAFWPFWMPQFVPSIFSFLALMRPSFSCTVGHFSSSTIFILCPHSCWPGWRNWPFHICSFLQHWNDSFGLVENCEYSLDIEEIWKGMA